MSEASPQLSVAGWREWIALPDLDVSWVKAKLDTGARSSTIHAWDVAEFQRDGEPWARFQIHPWQRSDLDAVDVELPVFDRRIVKSSTGHEEERLVVQTTIRESSAGPARKYYELTDQGAEILDRMNSNWKDIKSGTDALRNR